MLRKSYICFVLCLMFALIAQSRPQDDDYEEEEAGDKGPHTFNGEPPSTKYAPQCMYDFTGKRINQRCPCEQPPKCERGSIVKTSVGEDFEMCCCNFTNYIDE